MGIFAWANRKLKAYTVWDIGVLKLFCTLVGMILGAYLATFVLGYLWWFIVVSALFFIILMIRLFTTK